MSAPIFSYSGLSRNDEVSLKETIVNYSGNLVAGTKLRIRHFKPSHSGYVLVGVTVDGKVVKTKVNNVVK